MNAGHQRSKRVVRGCLVLLLVVDGRNAEMHKPGPLFWFFRAVHPLVFLSLTFRNDFPMCNNASFTTATATLATRRTTESTSNQIISSLSLVPMATPDHTLLVVKMHRQTPESKLEAIGNQTNRWSGAGVPPAAQAEATAIEGGRK